MASAFDGELARMRDSWSFTGREVDALSRGIGCGLRRAFDGLVFDGLKLSDALQRRRQVDGGYGLFDCDEAGAECTGRSDRQRVAGRS